MPNRLDPSDHTLLSNDGPDDRRDDQPEARNTFLRPANSPADSEDRRIEQSFSDTDRTRGERPGDDGSSSADRHRLGSSFADPNFGDDAKVGSSFVDANSTPKRRRARHHAEQPPKKPTNYRIFALVVVIVVLVFLVIFFAGFLPRHRRDQRTAAQARQEQGATPSIEAVRVARASAGSPLVVPGTTTPLTEAYIYARANGYLKRRLVDLGDHVRKGQLLAIIDSPDLDQQVDQAREQLRQAESQKAQQDAQLALARVTVERYRVLVAKGVFSRQDGDQQETNFSAQVANVAAAARNVDAYRANLNRTISLQSYEHVTAPFAGVITQRNVDLGSLISASGSSQGSAPASQPGPTSAGVANSSGSSGNAPTSSSPGTGGGGNGGPLFSVAQVDRLRILVSVPEGYAAQIRRGQTAILRVQEFPAEQFKGVVTRTSASIDQNTRTLLTEVQVDNRDGRLLNGMYAVVTFAPVAAGEGPITISGDAIAVRNSHNVVGLLDNGTVHIQPVEIGRDFGPVIEITSGLKAGDIIASTVTDDIRDGAHVNVHVSEEKSAAAPSGAQGQNQPVGGNSQYGDQSTTDRNLSGAGAQPQGKKGGAQGGQPAPTKGESKQ